MDMNKKGFEFSFAWLFALIVGAFILFLAIYTTTKLIRTSTYQLNTVTAKQLSIIFEPMETGLASGKSTKANLREETKIFNDCFEGGGFGKQRFSLSSKQGFGQKWSEKGPEGGIPVTNKYIFSEAEEQGKTIYFFSKPLELPWKISEIIFLSTSKYCFVDAPEEIEDEVKGLRLENIGTGNCSAQDIKVCFDKSECDITVRGSCFDKYECESEYEHGSVEKQGKTLNYVGSLMYAAIFSSPETYECNVNRLIKRLMQQALLLKDESDFLSVKCGTLPSTGLLQIAGFDFQDSQDLLLLRQISENLNKENEAANCQLW